MGHSKSFASLFLSLFIFTSCGGKQTNGKKIISLNEKKLERFVDELKFECESLNGEKCPEGISRLIIYNTKDPSESALCSGFLIKSDVLVTNNHCVSNVSECENTYINIYTEKGPIKNRCGSILHTEIDDFKNKNKKIDLTVMRLRNSTGVIPLELSSSEIRPEEKLRSWVVDHLSGREARITELECEFESHSPSIRLKNCPIILGNSGSPLLNERRDIVGVIWGSTVDEMIDASFPLDSRRNLKDFGFATSVDFFKEFIN